MTRGAWLAPMSRRSSRKYLNIPTAGFDSRSERARYHQLQILMAAADPRERVGKIERQVAYPLIPSQKDAQGRVIERAVSFIADFRITYGDGRVVVEDVKSPRTRKLAAYVIKRKLLLYVCGVRLREVVM